MSVTVTIPSNLTYAITPLTTPDPEKVTHTSGTSFDQIGGVLNVYSDDDQTKTVAIYAGGHWANAVISP